MSNKWEAIPPPAEILERIYAEEKFKDFDFFGAQMVVENLLIGPITVVTNNKLMKDIGITHVLSIINARPLFPKEFTYKVVDLKDLPSENLIIHLLDCISFIDDCIKQGGKVYVHCQRGVSRSAAVCAAYLMWKLKMTQEDALQAVAEARPVICPNRGFLSQLKQFELKLSASRRRAPSPQIIQRKAFVPPHCEAATDASSGSAAPVAGSTHVNSLATHHEEIEQKASPNMDAGRTTAPQSDLKRKHSKELLNPENNVSMNNLDRIIASEVVAHAMHNGLTLPSRPEPINSLT
jgi:predicted protein tyrosine phosphatase